MIAALFHISAATSALSSPQFGSACMTLACVLCCRVLVGLPRLWTRRCALPLSLNSYRFMPNRLSGGARRALRRASLLLLAPWLAVSSAQGGTFIRLTIDGQTCASAGFTDLQSASECETAIKQANAAEGYGERLHGTVTSVQYTIRPTGCYTSCYTASEKFFCE